MELQISLIIKTFLYGTAGQSCILRLFFMKRQVCLFIQIFLHGQTGQYFYLDFSLWKDRLVLLIILFFMERQVIVLIRSFSLDELFCYSVFSFPKMTGSSFVYSLLSIVYCCQLDSCNFINIFWTTDIFTGFFTARKILINYFWTTGISTSVYRL